MKTYRELLLSNKAWSQEMRERDPEYFSQQIAGQKPDILWIGCSDSRVSPEQITQTRPGELFIHRNIANIVHADDTNLLSVLQYAVDVLKVEHIVICGHYGCGGLVATLEGNVDGPVSEWLQSSAGVYRDHKDEIDAAGSFDQRVNRFVECNVRDQLIALARTDTVQAALARGQALQLHGWVYDLRDGIIKQLLDITGQTELDDIERPDSVLLGDPS